MVANQQSFERPMAFGLAIAFRAGRQFFYRWILARSRGDPFVLRQIQIFWMVRRTSMGARSPQHRMVQIGKKRHRPRLKGTGYGSPNHGYRSRTLQIPWKSDVSLEGHWDSSRVRAGNLFLTLTQNRHRHPRERQPTRHHHPYPLFTIRSPRNPPSFHQAGHMRVRQGPKSPAPAINANAATSNSQAQE